MLKKKLKWVLSLLKCIINQCKWKLSAKVTKHFKHMSHIRYKDKVLRIF